MSSITTSFHGIHPNGDHGPHQDFIVPIDASSNMGSGESVHPTPFDGVPAPSLLNPNNISTTQSSHEERTASLMNGVTDDASLALAFPTYDPFPHFQSPFPFARSSSPFLSGFPTPSESALAPSPSPSCENLPKSNHKSRGKNTKRTVMKSKIVANTRRTQRPTLKPHNKGFAVMFNKLPLEVQSALNTFYTGCCESMNDKDNSTRHKHMFSDQHRQNLPKKYIDMLPSFICPAYIAFHGACTRAKAGRYDSAERHCKSCPGFQEMNSKCRIFPVRITKAEYEAMTIYRNSEDKNAKVEEKTKRLVRNSVNKLLALMLGHKNFQIHEDESNFSEAIRAISDSLGTCESKAPAASTSVEQVGAIVMPQPADI